MWLIAIASKMLTTHTFIQMAGGGGYNVLCNSKYYLISTIAILLDIKESKEYQNVHHKIRLYLYRIPCNVFCTILEGEF